MPGRPLSVKEPKPGSPVRSLGWRVIVHPVGSPIRLCPSEVTPTGKPPPLAVRLEKALPFRR